MNGISPQLPPFVVSLPIDPQILNNAIKAYAGPGEAEFPMYRITLLCPAGTTTTYTLWMPSGFVGSFTVPIKYTADFYSPDINIRVYVDDTKDVAPVGIAFTGPSEIHLGQFYTVLRNIVGVITNGSAVDTTITIEVQASLLQKSFYEDWYRRILKHSWDVLNEIAVAMGGSRR